LIQEIIQQSGGNPFFIREILRDLMEGQHVVRRGGIWIWRDEGKKSLRVPKSLQDFLGEHLRRLYEPSRLLLQALAVWGEAISEAELHELTVGRKTPINRLHHLVQQEILRREEDGRYVFAQGSWTTLLSDSISPEARRELHARCARLLEDAASRPV